MTDRPDLVQQALVEELKADTTLVAELGSSADIKEREWQGTEFDYPAVRVHIISLGNYDVGKDCSQSPLEATCIVFSEEASSYQANRIAGIIKTVLHSKSWIRNGLQISLRATIIPAIRSDRRTWRSEVLLRGVVSG